MFVWNLTILGRWMSILSFAIPGQLETVEMETRNGNGKRKWSKLDANEC